MKQKKMFQENFSYRITLFYLVFGFLWIALSDKVLDFAAKNIDTVGHFQTYKGFFFVLVTALLLFFLVQANMKSIKKTNDLLEKRIQDYKILYEKFLLQNNELKLAKEEAEESNRLKIAFLQNISHEIRTPMNAICGFTNLLTEPDLTNEQKTNYSGIVRSNCDQLLTIISDVLTISSVETNQLKVNTQEVDLVLLMEELTQVFKPNAQSLSLEFRNATDIPNDQAFVLTDKTKLTQILTNLLTNALKFTRVGSIEMGCHIEGDRLHFWVKDTGIGFNPEIKEHLFERFRQADENINKRYGGTGLGLAISKAFVELMGGDIGVDSVPGKGSTFFFHLPLVQVQHMNASKKEPMHWKSGYTVLIAEDEDVNYLFLETLLQPMNWKLIRATNGQEAIELAQANENIQLILMDIRMPLLDGYQAAIAIKKFRPNLPILAQTAYANDYEIEKYEGVFDDYLTKPLRIQLLKNKISAYLS